jgi:hypothetical protein
VGIVGGKFSSWSKDALVTWASKSLVDKAFLGPRVRGVRFPLRYSLREAASCMVDVLNILGQTPFLMAASSESTEEETEFGSIKWKVHDLSDTRKMVESLRFLDFD